MTLFRFAAFVLCVIFVHVSCAQTAIDEFQNRRESVGAGADTSTAMAGEYGETEWGAMLGADPNLGEQLVLVEQTREAAREEQRFWLEASAGFTMSYVSNPAQTETNVRGATLGVASASAVLNLPGSEALGAQVSPTVGGLYQVYRYGVPDDDDRVVDGGPVDRLDFEALGAYAEASFQWEKWRLVAELQYNRLLAGGGSDDVFYEDIVPRVSLSYEWLLEDGARLVATWRAMYHFSDTESAGLLPDDWNDRWAQRLELRYETQLADQWWLVPSARLGYTDYMAQRRDRQDWWVQGHLALYWFFHENFYVSATASAETRDSSDPLTDDYDSYNMGLGANATVRF